MEAPSAIYLDYAATTPVDPDVLAEMLPFFTHVFGNASSRTHAFGWPAADAVELGDRVDDAGLVVHPHERHEQRVRAHRGQDVGDVRAAVGAWADPGHLEALPRQRLQAGEHRAMLERARHDVASRPSRAATQPEQGERVRFRRARGERDLAGAVRARASSPVP